jgi:cell division protein FtsB
MKILGSFLIIAVILCASPPISAELSVEDLEKIRQIVNESEVRLGSRIDEVKKELDTRIEDQGKRITDLRDRINFQGHLIIALIVAIIAFVAVPMGIIVYQYNRNRDQQAAEIKVLRDQQEEIETLRRRIEELERKPIIQA